MASKQITVGVGIPMIVVGGLIALLWAPAETELKETIEFVGSLIGNSHFQAIFLQNLLLFDLQVVLVVLLIVQFLP